MVGKRQRRSLKSQQFHPMKCGSMAFQIISSLLALRGLYAILASDEISYLNYSPSNIQSSQGNNNNNNNNHLQQLKKVFHPIHVYRGSETAIQNLDTKTTEMRQYYNPKSQVDQDKIVSALTKQLDAKISLIRKKLFFVDLAANDAIQLSNTLQLEEEGWHGLCIGTSVKWSDYRLLLCYTAGFHHHTFCSIRIPIHHLIIRSTSLLVAFRAKSNLLVSSGASKM
jgi:hypothetical protein